MLGQSISFSVRAVLGRLVVFVTSVMFALPLSSALGQLPVTPSYQNYPAPSGLGFSAGEPSIGADWVTGKVMVQASTQTLRVTFDDTSFPATAVWKDRSGNTAVTSLDSILFTDHNTGNHPNRTFESQLTGQDSLTEFTDDDGGMWLPSQGGGIPSGVDHQSIGAGPYAPPLTRDPNGLLYPNAVYYCSQDLATAFCARSDDGGITFGAGVPIYVLTQCGGMHGHVKVAPDGTVYVPNHSCGANQGLIVSQDNGVTWTVRHAGTSPAMALDDPSVGIGADGTIYFGYQDSNGHPRVTVSRDHGSTWTNDQDLGVAVGVRHAVFPAAVAGDDDRAAVTFIGTDNVGSQPVWYLYIATTFNGGATWETVNATPNDPVQRGTICDHGTLACNNVPDDRNLLDFIDATVDAQGRTLVVFADGCIDSCVQGPPNSYSALATIVRQTSGSRLFHAYDIAPPLVSVVSRMNHSSAGAFDILLVGQDPPPQGFLGIECRSGGVNGNYTIVFTFQNLITNVDGAAISSGTGTVASSNIDSNDAHNYVVNLTGVTNAQRITVGLTNVTDSVGNFSRAVSAQMGVLVGDVNGNGLVNSTDASLTQAQSGQLVTSANFRMDINANGLITSTDASIVQAQSGTGLP